MFIHLATTLQKLLNMAATTLNGRSCEIHNVHLCYGCN